MEYNRQKATAYAEKWAYSRNPAFYNFDSIGGDCTNFISQCLFAGSGVMNYKRDIGWYYHSLQDRSAAWSSVMYLHRFLTDNKGPGPYGEELPIAAAQPGDIVQLSFNGKVYAHSLLITDSGPEPAIWNIQIAAHTYDAYQRPLNSYSFQKLRFIHILGVR